MKLSAHPRRSLCCVSAPGDPWWPSDDSADRGGAGCAAFDGWLAAERSAGGAAASAVVPLAVLPASPLLGRRARLPQVRRQAHSDGRTAEPRNPHTETRRGEPRQTSTHPSIHRAVHPQVHTLYRSVGLFSLELHREVYRQLVGPALIELGLHLALPALLAKALTHSGRLLCLWELVSGRPLPFEWRALSMMEGGGVWFWGACFLQRYCYHLALLGRMAVVGLPAAGRALDRLHHQLRDQKYLVAATLLNYTPTAEDQQQAAAAEQETAPETAAAPASPPIPAAAAAASQHREWDGGLLGSVMRESLLGNL